MDLESLSFCLSHNYKRLFSLSVSLSLPLLNEWDRIRAPVALL